MSDQLRVRVKDVRQAVNRILDEVEAKHGGSLELNADYYWSADDRAAFAMVDAPEQHIVAGQLSDDLQELEEFLGRDPDEGVIIWHDLVLLCALLRRIASLDAPS